MRGIIAATLAATLAIGSVGGCASQEDALIRLEVEEGIGAAVGALIGGPIGFMLGSGLGAVGGAAGGALVGGTAGLAVGDAIADTDPDRADEGLIELQLK